MGINKHISWFYLRTWYFKDLGNTRLQILQNLFHAATMEDSIEALVISSNLVKIRSDALPSP